MKPRKRKASTRPFYLYTLDRATYDALPAAMLEELRAGFSWPEEYAATLARRISAGWVRAEAAQALSRDPKAGAGLITPFLLDPAPAFGLPGEWYRGRLILERSRSVRVYVNFSTDDVVTIGSEGRFLPPEKLYLVTPGLLH